jgi:ribosomal protein L37AE/L43A
MEQTTYKIKLAPCPKCDRPRTHTLVKGAGYVCDTCTDSNYPEGNEIYTCEKCNTDNEVSEDFETCDGCGNILNYEKERTYR